MCDMSAAVQVFKGKQREQDRDVKARLSRNILCYFRPNVGHQSFNTYKINTGYQTLHFEEVCI